MEIKIVNNKYGKFININEENYLYIHLYRNENKEEVKRIYLNENLEKLRIIIDYQIKSLERLFEDCELIEYIYFKKFFRNNITYMGSMFSRCTSLK